METLVARKNDDRRRLCPEAFERTLVTAAQKLTSHLNVTAVCEALAAAATELVGATSCAVLLRDKSTTTMSCVYATGSFAASVRGKRLPLSGEDPVAVVSQTGRSLFLAESAEGSAESVGRSSPTCVPARSADARPLLYVPLPLEGQTFGVLIIESPYLTRGTPPRADDLARLAVLAAQASIALSNARFYEESERDREHLRRLLEERRQLRGRVYELQKELSATKSAGGIITASGALKATLREVEIVAPADATVLLLGETGTGKELLARAIHGRSRRANHPFVAVNCASLPATLVESELFGHERGAFTDAVVSRPGKFEVAQRGTLFLDEIGDLPVEAQAKVLRALQQGEVQRVGSTKLTKIDVRVIAATNMDLQAAVADNRFRSDLYYRLAVFPILVPPLRERPDDIPVLAQHFLRLFASRFGRPIADIEPEAMERLKAYRWPGNVRELQNVIERAAILTRGPNVTSDAIALAPVPESIEQHPKVVSLAEAQRRAIVSALKRANWRISGRGGAADLLSVKPTTLYAKMKKLGIRRD